MKYEYSENVLVQDSAAALMYDELGWDVVFAYNQEVLGENGTLGRKDYREIVLWRYFNQALKKLNPWITEAQITEAKRLAYSIMGVKDVDRVMMVQFHQSYSYEDFIMGFRPSADGFDIKTGAFYNFCKKAERDGDNKYFFIIDEINRGNLSKIFGELFMLIENDKRGSKNKLQLLYRDEMFYVPENVYIIGMMNTADRSLAMLDYALRRRFAFFDLKPGFTTEGFRAYRDGIDNKKFEALVGCVQSLNEKIAADESLGEGFCIGHSYFCNMEPDEVTDEKLQSIVEYELIPMLKEYWFDEPLKVKEWSDNLRSAVK